jgi:hypothetical protein
MMMRNQHDDAVNRAENGHGDDRSTLLPIGKLPVGLLSRLTSTYCVPDPSVVVGPGVGRDAAAIDLGDRYLVV